MAIDLINYTLGRITDDEESKFFPHTRLFILLNGIAEIELLILATLGMDAEGLAISTWNFLHAAQSSFGLQELSLEILIPRWKMCAPLCENAETHTKMLDHVTLIFEADDCGIFGILT